MFWQSGWPLDLSLCRYIVFGAVPNRKSKCVGYCFFLCFPLELMLVTCSGRRTICRPNVVSMMIDVFSIEYSGFLWSECIVVLLSGTRISIQHRICLIFPSCSTSNCNQADTYIHGKASINSKKEIVTFKNSLILTNLSCFSFWDEIDVARACFNSQRRRG